MRGLEKEYQRPLTKRQAYSTDVLDQPDTVSLDYLEEQEQSQMNRAGVDDLTPVDNFINNNGDKHYVTEL